MAADSNHIAIAGTRESWLTRFHEAFRPYFIAKTNSDLPHGIRFSCGWPYNHRPPRKHQHTKIIGQTWPKELSKDNTFEIFVSPFLEDSLQVAGIVAHELCHVAAGCEHGHDKTFKRIAVALGLKGPMTATVVGVELEEAFKRLINQNLGPYPHAQLDDSRLQSSHIGHQKVQKARLIKVACDRTICGYSLWTTRMWLRIGIPTCPCGNKMSELSRR